MARGFKTGNDYAAAFGDLYAKTPKAVFAAVAFSFAERFKDESLESGSEDDRVGHTVRNFLGEWNTLHENGLIPQAPPKEIA